MKQNPSPTTSPLSDRKVSNTEGPGLEGRMRAIAERRVRDERIWAAVRAGHTYREVAAVEKVSVSVVAGVVYRRRKKL